MSTAHCRMPVAKRRTSKSMRTMTAPKVASRADSDFRCCITRFLIDCSRFSPVENRFSNISFVFLANARKRKRLDNLIKVRYISN